MRFGIQNMTLFDAFKEWLQYEPFEYLVTLNNDKSITVRRRGLEKYDNELTLQLRDPSKYITYTGIVVGSISSNGWIRIRGRYFYPSDPLFFEKLERELADTCVDPDKNWAKN